MFELPDGVELFINPRARRMALRLDSSKRRVRLVCPPRMPKIAAYKFAHDHRDWISKHLNALPPQIGFIDGSEIPVLGKTYKLKIIYDQTLRSTNIQLDELGFIVKTNLEDPTPRIKRFLKTLLQKTCLEMSIAKAEKLGKKVESVTVRETRSRWGSCSHDGHLSYSWRLVFAPFSSLDYVVAHEVAHLKHMDHSDAFWRTCAALSEDYNEGKGWMRQFGASLHAYGAA